MKPSFDLPDLDEIIDILEFSNKFINSLSGASFLFLFK
jgi:hypothetical protein